MKKTTMVIAIIALIIAVFNLIVQGFALRYEPDDIDFKSDDERFLEQFENYRVYDSSEVTCEILESRTKDTVIIERCIGRVLDSQTGDGVLLNARDRNYAYINYRMCKFPIHDGMIIVTYVVFNTENNYTDDFNRYDFVLFE